VTAFFFRVSSLHTGAGIVFLLPEVGSSRDRAYQAIISVRVKIEGFSIGR